MPIRDQKVDTMDDLIKTIEYVINYSQAMSDGAQRWAAALPVLTRQQIGAIAKRKLQSTRENYMSALKINMDSYILVVDIDRENFMANAVEVGVSSFNMKAGLLASPKAKIGKNGYRYIRVPMGKEKDYKPGTEAGQDFQNRIMEVLGKPKYGGAKRKINLDGSVFEYQKVIHNDPKVQGLYRTRKFDSTEDVYSGKKPKWGHVLFRVVSENPESKAKWDHPGVTPRHILLDAERWLNQSAEILLENYIQEEIGRI